MDSWWGIALGIWIGLSIGILVQRHKEKKANYAKYIRIIGGKTQRGRGITASVNEYLRRGGLSYGLTTLLATHFLPSVLGGCAKLSPPLEPKIVETTGDAYQAEQIAPGLRVPLMNDSPHWRFPGLSWELMSPFAGILSDKVYITAVTILAMKDLGYIVDRGKGETPPFGNVATKIAVTQPRFLCDGAHIRTVSEGGY